MPVDARLVEKGADEPREALAEQGKASVELATKNAEALAKKKWTAAKTDELKSKVALLETEVAEQAEAFVGAVSAKDAKQIAIDNAKKFIREMRLALPECLRETAVKNVTAEAFEAGGPLRRDSKRISAYLTKIRPALVALDDDLKGYFGDVAPSTIVDTLKTELDTASAKRTVVLSELPEATQQIYEAKGRVLELIEDLNRAGKGAFDGDAVKMAQFNKDIVLRARRARKHGTTTTTTAT